MCIGEQPVPRVGLPAERRVEQVPDPAVRAVAADDEAREDAVLASRQVADPGAHRLPTDGEIEQFDAGLDAAAQLGDPRPEQRLGAVLGQMQDEPVRRSGVGHVDAEQALATRVQPDAAHAVALVQESVGDAHHVQRFQRARGDADRPAEPWCARVLVDHAGADAAGEQLGGQHQSGRAGADDEHIAICARDVRGHAAHPARGEAAGRPKNYVGATYFAARVPVRGPRR